MSQARYFDYGQTLTSDAYAFLLRQAFVPGVYQGLDVSTGATPDEILIAPGTVLLGDGVLVSENETQTIKLGSLALGQYLVVVRHRLQPPVGGIPAVFDVIPYDNLEVWAAGYSYYVIATITFGSPVGSPPQYQTSIANAQKIKARIQQIIETFSPTSISQSFVAPLTPVGGSSSVTQQLSVLTTEFSEIPVLPATVNLPNLRVPVKSGNTYKVEFEIYLAFGSSYTSSSFQVRVASTATVSSCRLNHEYIEETADMLAFTPTLKISQSVLDITQPISFSLSAGQLSEGRWKVEGVISVTSDGEFNLEVGSVGSGTYTFATVFGGSVLTVGKASS